MTDFGRDPEALAWARGKIEAAANRYEAFAERAAAEGRNEQAAEWRAMATAVRHDLIGGPGCVIASFDERLPALEEHSGASPAAVDSRIVSFDLMPREPDYYFVLSEALREFAGRQRAEAEDAGEADAAARIRWADTAEDALDQIEEALSTPATVEGIVAASIEQQGDAMLAQLDAELTQHRSEPGDARGDGS